MFLNKQKVYSRAFFSAVFFTFSGYYVLLILLVNLVGKHYSRYMTVPLRILILLLLFSCLQLLGKKSRLDKPILVAFALFSFFYILRIIIEILKGSVVYQSNESFLLYYLSFAVFPFILLLFKKEYAFDLKLYKIAILLSGAMVSVLSVVFYRQYIGAVGRINLALTRSDQDYVSPLHFSDTSALSIGVALFILLTNTTTKVHKFLLIGVILLSCIPFFLGAGRSSVLALIVPFLFFMVVQNNKVKSFYIFIGLLSFTTLLFFMSELLGSSLVERFMSIEDGIESGSSAAVRADIWKFALSHFFDNPIFGYSLQVPETGHHAHNIIFEILLATGILGIIPFMYLLIRAFKNSIAIIKYKPEASWVVVIFFQSLIITLFHGTVYGDKGSWFWFSLAFILSMSNYKQVSVAGGNENKKVSKELVFT